MQCGVAKKIKVAILRRFLSSLVKSKIKNIKNRRFLLLKTKKVVILRDFYYLSLLEVRGVGVECGVVSGQCCADQ